MKHLFIILLCSLSMVMEGQQKVQAPNTIVTNDGNYKEIVDLKIDKTYTNKEGKVFDVYITSKNKIYIITGISEKTGKPKKKYLIIK